MPATGGRTGRSGNRIPCAPALVAARATATAAVSARTAALSAVPCTVIMSILSGYLPGPNSLLVHAQLYPGTPRVAPNRRTVPARSRILAHKPVAVRPWVIDSLYAGLTAICAAGDEPWRGARVVAGAPLLRVTVADESKFVRGEATGHGEIPRAAPSQPVVHHIKHEPIAAANCNVDALRGGPEPLFEHRALRVGDPLSVQVHVDDEVIRNGDKVRCAERRLCGIRP